MHYLTYSMFEFFFFSPVTECGFAGTKSKATDSTFAGLWIEIEVNVTRERKQ